MDSADVDSEFRLDLVDLSSKKFGLTPNTGGYLAEAASVCLESQHHDIETEITQVEYFQGRRTVIGRLEVTREMEQSHRDDNEATHNGAEGIAMLLLIETGVAKEFSRARTAGRSGPDGGFDYWFVTTEISDKIFVFEHPDAGRLEVSGLRQGSEKEVQARLIQKVKQTTKSDEQLGDRDTFAIVVEFGQPQIWVRKR